MKRIVLACLLGSLLVGCGGNRTDFARLETTTYEASHIVVDRGEGGYSLCWPKPGQLPDATMQQLLYACFDTVDSTNPEVAVRQWMTQEFSVGDTNIIGTANIYLDIRQYGRLACCSIRKEYSSMVMAHGFYTQSNLTIDMVDGRMLTLPELVDTTRLGTVLSSAVQDLDTNHTVRQSLFDEYAQQFPPTDNFFIDSTCSHISFVYNLYEVASYADGIQTVVVPVSWLAERMQFTPYGKELLNM